MARDRIPPPPAPVYEGIRWLGSQWGRSGNPKPAKLGGWFALLVTCIVWFIAMRAYDNAGVSVWVIGNAIVGAICALTAGFYFIEAHFAERVANEQRPLPSEPNPSVGP